MKRKGVSHIEMVISFVLFIAFVTAALYFFTPTNTGRLIESTLTYSFREIEVNSSVELDIINVKMNTSSSLPSTVGIYTGLDLSGKEVYAENFQNEKVVADIAGDNIILQSNDWERDGFISVRLSEDIENEDFLSPTGLEENKYEIASVVSKKVLSEKRLLELNKSYHSDYLGVKKMFNLPGRADFGFRAIIKEEYEIVAEKNKPSATDVFSDSKKVDIMTKEGKLYFGDLIVEVW
jgi:hypothetical protein